MVIEYFMEWVQTASVTKRADAAAALARACLRVDLNPDERDEIEAALTVLLEDNSPSVRTRMAETFGAFASAPRHIITALASDTSETAVIVLSQSPVFHDAELVSFIRKGAIESQIAISCRPWLSAHVASAICEYGCKDAALGLLMNPAAGLGHQDLHMLAERYGTNTEIRQILLQKEELSAETRHILIGKLGEALGGLVRQKAWLSEERVQNTISEAFDKASIIFAANTREEDVRHVVQNLIRQNRLTVSFLVRAICMGNITLVAHAFSVLSGMRFNRVESIVTGNRKSAFRALYERAGLPASAFVVFETALGTWRRLLESGSEINQSRLPFIVTREVLEKYAGASDTVMDELLVLLRRLSAETARESSRAKAYELATSRSEIAEAGSGDTDDIEEAEVISVEEPEENILAANVTTGATFPSAQAA